jgi:hypothetical protein
LRETGNRIKFNAHTQYIGYAHYLNLRQINDLLNNIDYLQRQYKQKSGKNYGASDTGDVHRSLVQMEENRNYYKDQGIQNKIDLQMILSY